MAVTPDPVFPQFPDASGPVPGGARGIAAPLTAGGVTVAARLPVTDGGIL
ncbi:MAG: hypothetical protein Kow0026_12470 [Oricola sp.]